MNLTDDQKKILIMLVILGVLGLGATAYFWFMIGKTEIESRKEKVVAIKAETEEFQRKLDKIEAFREKYEGEKYLELKELVEGMEKRLPTTRQATEFFEALKTVLGNTGVVSERLAVNPVVEGGRFEEIPYSVNMVGRFHEFGQFLNLVEQNPERYMRIKTLKVSNDLEKPNRHPIEVNISTFRFIVK